MQTSLYGIHIHTCMRVHFYVGIKRATAATQQENRVNEAKRPIWRTYKHTHTHAPARTHITLSRSNKHSRFISYYIYFIGQRTESSVYVVNATQQPNILFIFICQQRRLLFRSS